MAEKKKGLFGRLFGGDAPSETDTVDPAATESETPYPEPEDQPVAETPDMAADPIPDAATLVDERPEEEPVPAEAEPPAKRSWFQRLTGGLTRTSSQLTGSITGLFTKRKLDDAALEELEDVLLQADLGVETATAITEALAKGRYDKEISPDEIRAVMAEEIAKVLDPVAEPLTVDAGNRPHIVLVVGVNGSGKTTTIGKLGARFTREGKSVMLAAGDTFRAAAVEQLKIWGERIGAPVIAKEHGADAASLAYEAIEAARRDSTDVLLIDTAGRLQNKSELMAELAKVVRVIQKLEPDAPHDTVLVLDATVGQNALRQVEVFREMAGVSGIVMTKLDGTARGGILVAIAAKFGLPVHAIGVGEGVGDLEAFSAEDFAGAIAGHGAHRPEA